MMVGDREFCDTNSTMRSWCLWVEQIYQATIIIRYFVSSHLIFFQWCISASNSTVLLQLGPSCTWAPQSCQYKHSKPTASQYALLNCHIFRKPSALPLLVAMVSVGCGCFLGQRDLHWAFGQRWFPSLPWLEVVETVKPVETDKISVGRGEGAWNATASPLWQSPKSMWSWGVK